MVPLDGREGGMTRSKQIKVCDFTQTEIEVFLQRANFTPDEETLFLLRSKNYTLEQAAEEMNVSSKTAYRLNKKVKQKIITVCMEISKYCP